MAVGRLNRRRTCILPAFAYLVSTLKPFIFILNPDSREAILLNLRSQFYKASSPEGSADALQDVQKTLLKAKGRLQTGDVRRFARELVEDEGVLKGGPGGEEEKFWEEVVNALYA